MNFFSRWQKPKSPPVTLTDCEYTSDRKPDRRWLLGLLSGATAASLASRAAAQQLNPPAWQTGYIYVNGGTTVNTNIQNPTPYNLTNLNIVAAGNITTWNVALPTQPFDGQIITITQGNSTVSNLNIIPPAGVTVNNVGFGSYQFQSNQSVWFPIQITFQSLVSSGITSVTTQAALGNLPPAKAQALLTGAGIGGTFTWTAGNYTAAVTNDPQQGIYIPWSGDTSPGASGAWVRNNIGIVNIQWFGAVGDGTGTSGGTENYPALNGFGTWARWNQTGAGLTLLFPPGQYNFNGQFSQQWLYGIYNLKILGYGATLQNTYNGASNFGYQLPMGSVAANPVLLPSNAYLINTTTANATSVTCITAANAGNFTPGMSVMVGSLDIQYSGYPPNLDQFDFTTVVSANATTGVIVLKDSLTFIHRSDFADGGNSSPCGKARIYPLDATAAQRTVASPWAVSHVYEGLTINIAANATLTYQTFTGKSIFLKNVTITGISPSQIDLFHAEGCTFLNANEPDKLINRCIFDKCKSYGTLNFQSSSVNVVKAIGCDFVQFQSGNAKLVIVDTCKIQSFNDGGYLYGCPRDVIIINSRIAAYPTPPGLGGFPNYNLTVDGTNSIYANGVFTILDAGAYPNNPVIWNTIVGNEIYLVQTSISGVPYDKGVGFVTSITDSGSGSVLIATTFPYATLPSFASGAIGIKKRGRVFVYGSSGCDVIDNLNDSTFNGFLPGQWFRAVLFGAQPSQTIGQPYFGNLLTLTINVRQASTIAGAKLTFNSFNATTIPALTGGVTYTIVIDLTVAGLRQFTQSALTGKVGADSVTLNSVAQTSLPAVYCPANGALGTAVNYVPSSYTPAQLPLADYTLTYDYGITGQLVPYTPAVGISGQLP